jgi:hypothetical protein
MSERSGCGCGEGKTVGALYVVAVPFAFLLTPLSIADLGSWGVVLAGLTCATLAGKLYGMLRSRAGAPEALTDPPAPAPRASPADPQAEGVAAMMLQHRAFDALSVGFEFVALPRSGLRRRGTPYAPRRGQIRAREGLPSPR